MVVMKKSTKDKLLESQIHGKPLVHFDKVGVVKDVRLDPAAFVKKIKTRLEMLKATFELFQVLTLKELNRGNNIEALSYYFAYTLRPLIEVLRMKYCPEHHNFYTSYLSYDLPAEIVKPLRKFYFLPDGKVLRRRHTEAADWFRRVVKTVSFDAIRRRIT